MTGVKILGKTWSIERVPEAPLQGNSLGRSNSVKCVIHLLEGQHPEQEADTLLHEIIHAIDYAVSLDLEERQVHALASGLFAVFRDNPELAKALGFA